MAKTKTDLYITAKLTLFISLTVALIGISFIKANAANNPGCYKIEGGLPQSVTCPTTNVVYDNGRGRSVDAPVAGNCYVYTKNLFDGDQTYGDPYVETDCNKLNQCPDNQELRYSAESPTTPQCVDTGTVASGSYGQETVNTGAAIKSNLNGFDANGNPIEAEGNYYCGAEGGKPTVKISFDIGCLNTAYGQDINPILDMAFALLRIVSAGVGIVVAGSIVWAGIQYSTSRGDPKATESSRKRIANSIVALLIYIFSYAILNFIVPGGLFIR